MSDVSPLDRATTELAGHLGGMASPAPVHAIRAAAAATVNRAVDRDEVRRVLAYVLKHSDRPDDPDDRYQLAADAVVAHLTGGAG